MPLKVQQYFEWLNQKEFQQAASLFAEQGALVPPFEKPIVGRKSIAQYMEKEAFEMMLIPKQLKSDETVGDIRTVVIKGKVKHPLFGVGVSWRFSLDTAGSITRLDAKLLASMKTLMGISR